MIDDILVAPSMLAADVLHLQRELDDVATADYLHYDVMDGRFVPNLSFGPDMLRAIASATDLPVDAHLMVAEPEGVVADYVRAGASIVTFHIEAQRHAMRAVAAVHDAGARVGVAINPGTSVGSLAALVKEVDLVLVMSVNPGFGGQRFLEGTFDQLRSLRRLCDEHDAHPLVEVDGGVGAQNAEALCAAGVDVLVAGSSVFGAPDRVEAIARIRSAGRRGVLRRA